MIYMQCLKIYINHIHIYVLRPQLCVTAPPTLRNRAPNSA